ncbi:thioesterase thiol ester dehydrase-isomerase [Coniophora puteana RWD-64-598 SS2]|uniref:Thioesterase thiol ester dehydrase-isomerase n=1 Tax=Coniophora puteana (strain RWD-64-598) TaxID=741705 RepID=A0A5M3N025_CONPW|nr:thioesterase thiol ester dehydrase-isomerase [Coniophora puteana RWD-64-598 SS2]EIW84718.1 thioesterase thiol ester dehydrase-isomerase [Coniophora puteana RWD-64-598 SS2]
MTTQATAAAGSTSVYATHAHVQTHINHLLHASPVYGHFFANVSLHSASPGRVVVHLPIERCHLNSKGSLHGAVSATLVDFMGGLAIAAYDSRDHTGVSTDMHVSFLGGAKEGETLEVEGRVDRCGGTLAYTSVVVRKLDGEKGEGRGDVVSMGSHTKFVKQR